MESSRFQVTIAIGLALTIAAFVAGHFLYQAGSERLGYAIGVAALAPLAISTFTVWRRSRKMWARILFCLVLILWGSLLLFPLM